MKAKVKKFFSEIFVKTYDYPFIVGFLEANGIDGVVPSLKQKGNRTCVNYEIFKDWWKQNYEEDHQEGTMVGIDYGDFNVHTEISPERGVIEYTITQGDKSAVINIAEALDEFVKYNTEQAERFIFKRPHFKGLEYFIRKHIVSDIL